MRSPDIYLRVKYFAKETFSQTLVQVPPDDGPEFREVRENIDFVIRFKNEAPKDELGNTLKLLLLAVDPARPDPRFCEQYDEVELKYKAAKVLESRLTSRALP